MAQANITFRMDENLKKQAEELFNELGMNLTTAYTIFTKAALRYHGLPFDVVLEIPNAETVAAIEEAEKISRDPNTRRYANFSELLEEVQNEV